MARSRVPRRQFVWARKAGVIGLVGGGANAFVQDLLDGVRVRYGDAVLRGATVMGIRGYARPNAQGSGVPIRFRFAVRVADTGEIDDTIADQREIAPFFSPESDWMLFHQSLVIGEQAVASPASSSRGSEWAVETQASRKFAELGQTLAVFADFQNTNGTPIDTGNFDYDLSIGLKLP